MKKIILLIEATNDGNEVIVKECIKLGADALYRTTTNEYCHQTSFEIAIREGKIEIFKMLFDVIIEKFKTNDDEKFKNKTFSYLLSLASACDEFEIVKNIFEKVKVIPHEYIILDLINSNKTNSTDILKILVDNGLDLKTVVPTHYIDYGKIDLKKITFLVENGLPIEKITTGKLDLIILDDNTDVFKYIANKINLKKSLTYLLSSAVAFEKNDIAKYLISIGAKPENKKIKECIKSMK